RTEHGGNRRGTGTEEEEKRVEEGVGLDKGAIEVDAEWRDGRGGNGSADGRDRRHRVPPFRMNPVSAAGTRLGAAALYRGRHAARAKQGRNDAAKAGCCWQNVCSIVHAKR